MAGNTFGQIFKLTTFGESHGTAIGAIVDGCPAGLSLSDTYIQKKLDRRKPSGTPGGAGNKSVTQRNEADKVRILSGVFEGQTLGTPIALLIENTQQHSSDYSNIKDTFRPGHGDWTYTQKYGIRDYRGGGRASARETACRVAGGAVASAFLDTLGIDIIAYTIQAAGIKCEQRDLSVIEKNPLRACDMTAASKMNDKIAQLRENGDSAGGVVECVIKGCPAGLGEPVFDKIDAELAKAMLSIGAVKGIEFGAGFASADMTGSTHNDAMRITTSDSSASSPTIKFLSNNAGGILAGITSGQDIIFRVAIKPVASIFQSQKTVSLSDECYEETDLVIKGRHDVCLCPRAVPVIEAMSALVIADMILRQRCARV